MAVPRRAAGPRARSAGAAGARLALALTLLVGVGVLVAAPPTADVSAHANRAGLWAREGLTVWNAQWYGGHHVLGYSLLYSPLAAAIGVRLVGVLAGLAAVWAFGRIVAGAPRAGLGTLAFAAGVGANLVIARMPFLLGVAFAAGAWLAVDRARGRPGRAGAAALALAATWSSPVAGVFLGLLAAARWVAGHDRRGALVLGAPVAVGGGLLVALFPEGGADRFTPAAFWPMLAVSVGAGLLVDSRRRGVLAAVALSVAMLLAAFVLPSPFGQNALRLGLLLGLPALAMAASPRAPRAAVAGVAAVLAYLAWLPAVRAVREAQRDPSAQPGFQAEAREFLRPRVRPGERVEVPLTLNHREAADLAPAFALARGWERQLDIKVNPLFYEDGLTPERYARWLRETAVGWVALPLGAPLDYSARAERAVLERGVPGLVEAGRTRRWRFWRVAGGRRGVEGPGEVVAQGPESFAVRADAPGRLLVRQRHTRFWHVERGSACLRRAGEWTELEVARPGRVEVRARLGPGGPRCPDGGGGG